MSKLYRLIPILFIALLVVSCEDESKTSDGNSGSQTQVSGEHKAALNRGNAAYKAKDFRTAYNEWLAVAEAGNARGQYLVGFLLDRGKGIEKDESKANDWFLKAAEQGRADAQYELGANFVRGRGALGDMDKDAMRQEGVKWLRAAAEQGLADAQYKLAVQLNYGYGVPNTVDQAAQWKEAVKWFRAAAEQGHAKAQGWLGDLYQMGRGVPKSTTEAVKWYKLGAAQGDRNSLASLAGVQAGNSGDIAGVEIDDELAVENYRRAAQKGYYWAARSLWEMYEEGRGSLSAEEIVEIFEELAPKTTDGTGQSHLARIYLEGRLTKRDPSKAAYWLEKAAKRGFTRHYASYRLAKLYLAGDGVPRDTRRAAELLEVAGENGNADARLSLAFLFANGDGVPQDLVKAYYWASLAAREPHDREGVIRALKARSYFQRGMTAEQAREARSLLKPR